MRINFYIFVIYILLYLESKKKSVEYLDFEGMDIMEGFYFEGVI